MLGAALQPGTNRSGASLWVSNQLISRRCEGQREQHEGKSSVNSRVCFSRAHTDMVLGCWEQPEGWRDPGFHLTWLSASAAAPATASHLQQHCLIFLPEHSNHLPSEGFPSSRLGSRLSSPCGARPEIGLPAETGSGWDGPDAETPGLSSLDPTRDNPTRWSHSPWHAGDRDQRL